MHSPASSHSSGPTVAPFPSTFCIGRSSLSVISSWWGELLHAGHKSPGRTPMPRLDINTVFPVMGIPVLKTMLSWNSLIFIMGILKISLYWDGPSSRVATESGDLWSGAPRTTYQYYYNYYMYITALRSLIRNYMHTKSGIYASML